MTDLSIVFVSLRRGLGLWAARGLISHVVALLVYGRLGRAEQQIGRLMVLFLAGKLRQRVVRMAAEAAPARVDEARVRPARVLPMQFAWLVRQARWDASALGSQLNQVLIRPDMVALLRACPQAARVLRPVCRMLAIPGEVLRPLPEGQVVAVRAEVAPKVKRGRVKRPPINWGRIPLPRRVLTAARRAGFKPFR